jgi:hypothetical protein
MEAGAMADVTREGWTRHRIEVTRRGLILHTARDIRHALAERYAEAELEWGAQHGALADGVIAAHLNTLVDILESARAALTAQARRDAPLVAAALAATEKDDFFWYAANHKPMLEAARTRRVHRGLRDVRGAGGGRPRTPGGG